MYRALLPDSAQVSLFAPSSKIRINKTNSVSPKQGSSNLTSVFENQQSESGLL